MRVGAVLGGKKYPSERYILGKESAILYSVYHMPGHDDLAAQFVGGTVVDQAFLSVLSYHRGHSPVSGEVVRAFLINGT